MTDAERTEIIPLPEDIARKLGDYRRMGGIFTLTIGFDVMTGQRTFKLRDGKGIPDEDQPAGRLDDGALRKVGAP